MANPEVTTRILRKLLAGGANARVEKIIARLHPADLAPLLHILTPDEVRTVVDLLFRHHRAADVLIELPADLLPKVFDAISDERLAEVIARAELDDMLEFIERLPEDRRESVVNLLPNSTRYELRKAALYPPESAGRAMTTNYVALDEKMTAQEAIDHIRAAGDISDSILYLYVVDDQTRLRGVVPIRRLVSAPPARPIEELMVKQPISAKASDDQEAVAQIVARYNLLAIPITDADETLLGIITVDDVIDVITEEATEDIYHLAGLSEEDRVFSPAMHSIRKRLPWMILNLGTAFLAAGVVSLFERTLDEVVTLAIFLPVVGGMGGNAGTQSLTVITRGIALGEIEFSSGVRAALKEMSVGMALGAVTGILSALAAYLLRPEQVYLGLVLFLAMTFTLTISGLVGAAVPLALKALRQDPAMGSGVIVTTFTDITGFSSFLGIGTLLWRHFQ